MRSTIFGLSSAAGRAGVSVFRVSGPRVPHVWSLLTGGRKELPKERVATLTRLIKEDSVLDECLALYFPKPRSFSGEDMLELHVHGSLAVQAALTAALSNMDHVRVAEPGEFTRRAFDNGKLSLLQVEGLVDLVGSETEAQRRQALQQLQGDLGKLYEGWRTRAIRLLAHVEAVIDFGEEEHLDADTFALVMPRAAELLEEVQRHLDDGRRGELVRQGAKMAIVGPPNSGKSSLYNALLQRRAAIVSDIPGTTRDVLEAPVDLGGYAVLLCDTAGIRKSTDPVEQIGIARAKEAADEADIVLLLLDAAKLEKEMPVDWLAIEESLNMRGKASIVVFNKSDLVSSPSILQELANECADALDTPVACISCKEARLEQLVSSLTKILGPDVYAFNALPVLTRARHRAHVTAAARALESFLAPSNRGAECKIFPAFFMMFFIPTLFYSCC